MKITAPATNLLRLSQANLAKMDPSVVVPTYNRDNLQAGVLHVGVGNFHRAHMAAYLNDLFEIDEDALQFGICGAGMRGPDQTKRCQILKDQDYLFTIVERDGDVANAKVVGSHMECLDYDKDHKSIQEKLLEENIKIVSMTVTEGGYFLTADGELDVDNKDIQYDAENPDTPNTLFGVLVKALKLRKEKGLKPFTVMCCDNLPHNGDVVRKVVVGLAAMSDPDLSKWIDDNVQFPNGMVDRITPATTPSDLTYIQDTWGYDDTYPVLCEPFTQWVLEDFDNRPALEKVGVQFVSDVTPFETMKIRILNGGHASLCYPAALLGLDYVHDALEHEVLGEFLDTLERNEIVPTVPPVPDQDLVEYWKIIQKRFINPEMGDRIDRNCASGSDRQPKFIIPAIKENLKAGRDVDGLATVCAMWSRFCQGTTESGDEIPANDALWDQLTETAEKAKSDPNAWIGMKDIYGDAGADKKFQESFAAALKCVNEEGVEAAMKRYIEASKK